MEVIGRTRFWWNPEGAKLGAPWRVELPDGTQIEAVTVEATGTVKARYEPGGSPAGSAIVEGVLRFTTLTVAALLALACSVDSFGSGTTGRDGSASDARTEGAIDSATETATDAGSDSSTDSAIDAPPDTPDDRPVDLGPDAYIHGWPFVGWPDCQPAFDSVQCPKADESAFYGSCPPSICHAADGGLCCR